MCLQNNNFHDPSPFVRSHAAAGVPGQRAGGGAEACFSLGLLSRLRLKHDDILSSSRRHAAAGVPGQRSGSGAEYVISIFSISNVQQRHGLLGYQDTGLEPMQRTSFCRHDAIVFTPSRFFRPTGMPLPAYQDSGLEAVQKTFDDLLVQAGELSAHSENRMGEIQQEIKAIDAELVRVLENPLVLLWCTQLMV